MQGTPVLFVRILLILKCIGRNRELGKKCPLPNAFFNRSLAGHGQWDSHRRKKETIIAGSSLAEALHSLSVSRWAFVVNPPCVSLAAILSPSLVTSLNHLTLQLATRAKSNGYP